MLPNRDELIVVAQLGKTVGLQGEIKLHNKSDFPEQFQKGAVFYLKDGTSVCIQKFNSHKQSVIFEGKISQEDVSMLVNSYLYTTKEMTKSSISLDEQEYFYFDIVGLDIEENGEKLGVIVEIENIAGINYFVIETAKYLVESGYAKIFMLPYVDRYIKSCDLQKRCVDTMGAKDILEAS